MRRSLLWGLAVALGAGTLLFSTASSAQEYTTPSTSSAQEYAAVVRLAVASGSVSIRQAGSSQTVPAAVNAPLTAGDYVLTGDASRAELQIDDANFIRASEDVQLRLSRVEQTDHEVQLAAGTIELSVLKVTGGLTSVQTPAITIMPADAGIFRITV
ncbi:MAG TPA: hypothetical protein VFF60_03450, partial [Candidatus Binatus sp.]|nr:hypothetical protein [Candidatus Binatus sp.]